MKKIDVFDPALCYGSGVCGVAVDPRLLGRQHIGARHTRQRKPA